MLFHIKTFINCPTLNYSSNLYIVSFTLSDIYQMYKIPALNYMEGMRKIQGPCIISCIFQMFESERWRGGGEKEHFLAFLTRFLAPIISDNVFFKHGIWFTNIQRSQFKISLTKFHFFKDIQFFSETHSSKTPSALRSCVSALRSGVSAFRSCMFPMRTYVSAWRSLIFTLRSCTSAGPVFPPW